MASPGSLIAGATIRRSRNEIETGARKSLRRRSRARSIELNIATQEAREGAARAGREWDKRAGLTPLRIARGRLGRRPN